MKKTAELIAAGIMVIGSMTLGYALHPQSSFHKDHQLIQQLVRANDQMQPCHGYAALEMKADGSSEIVGSCK